MTTPAPPERALIYRADYLATADLPTPEPLLVHKKTGHAVLTIPAMVEGFGATGVGKSQLFNALAVALAAGVDFLEWSVPKPRRVLYIDGEMPGGWLRHRILDHCKWLDVDPLKLSNLAVMARDWQRTQMRRLDTRDGQKLIAPFLTPNDQWTEQDVADENDALAHMRTDNLPALLQEWAAEVVIMDNAVSLFDPRAELDAEAWQPGQQWLTDLRDAGITSILIHHAGRDGSLGRGHSSREDLMDVVWGLIRPANYSQEMGCRFDLHWTKGRSVWGEAAADLAIRYSAKTGWHARPSHTANE